MTNPTLDALENVYSASLDVMQGADAIRSAAIDELDAKHEFTAALAYLLPAHAQRLVRQVEDAQNLVLGDYTISPRIKEALDVLSEVRAIMDVNMRALAGAENVSGAYSPEAEALSAEQAKIVDQLVRAETVVAKTPAVTRADLVAKAFALGKDSPPTEQAWEALWRDAAALGSYSFMG